MKKIYFLMSALMLTLPLLKAQDTLKHYDIFGSGGVHTPLETQAQPAPWGFRYGHGIFGLKEFAEKYYLAEETSVIGVMVLLGEYYTGTHSNDNAFVKLYGLAENGGPGANAKVSKDIAMTGLNLGMNNPTVVLFDEPYSIKDSFFASFGYPGYDFNPTSPNYKPTKDTLALYVTLNRNDDPDSNVWYRNAVRYPSGNWENPNSIVLDDKINFCISPIVTVTNSIQRIDVGTSIQVSQVYPNPAIDHVNFKLSTEKKVQARISLFDLSGRTISAVDYDLIPGEHQLRVDIDQSLDAQQLIAVVQTNDGMISLLIQKQ